MTKLAGKYVAEKEKRKKKEWTKTHVRTTAADGDHVVEVEFGVFVAQSLLWKVVQRLAGCWIHPHSHVARHQWSWVTTKLVCAVVVCRIRTDERRIGNARSLPSLRRWRWERTRRVVVVATVVGLCLIHGQPDRHSPRRHWAASSKIGAQWQIVAKCCRHTVGPVTRRVRPKFVSADFKHGSAAAPVHNCVVPNCPNFAENMHVRISMWQRSEKWHEVLSSQKTLRCCTKPAAAFKLSSKSQHKKPPIPIHVLEWGTKATHRIVAKNDRVVHS